MYLLVDHCARWTGVLAATIFPLLLTAILFLGPLVMLVSDVSNRGSYVSYVRSLVLIDFSNCSAHLQDLLGN